MKSQIINPEKQVATTGGSAGCLIVNADDWGRDTATTDHTLECFEAKAISSASAMVFMADSERAADLSRQYRLDCGLHLNLTTPFSAPGCPVRLNEHQQKVTRYLRWNRFASICFHPGLASSFAYVVAAQLAEFRRIYGSEPTRIDGHHHMHLCANVLFDELLPAGTIARRNFSFHPGEKSLANRMYRKFVDGRLKRRHRLVDFLFNLQPMEPMSRLQRIASVARESIVELETHPINAEEYRFLTQGGLSSLELQIAPRFSLPLERSDIAHVVASGANPAISN